jgi:hypothetical protein
MDLERETFGDLYAVVHATLGTAGPWVLTVTYVNQDGVAGRIGTITINNQTAQVCYGLAMQEGDTGVQRVTDVVASGATAGSYQLVLVKRIFGALHTNLASTMRQFWRTGLPELHADACLSMLVECRTNGAPTLIDMQLAYG